MAIEVIKAGDRYTARVSPPDSKEEWQTTEALSREDLVDALLEAGCHLVDIFHMIDQANGVGHGGGA